MKTFAEFQEEIKKKVPSVKELGGLGGGGGGTDAITDKSKSKSLKKRIKDVGKLATVPFRAVLGIKSKPDPTEKFATEGVASLALKGGSKIIPTLMTGIGAAGTIMQAKRKYKTRNNPTARTSKRRIGNMEKEYHKKEQGDRSNDMIVAKQGEAQKQNKLIDKYEKKQKSTENNLKRRNFVKRLKGDIPEEAMAPTNNVGGGKIAGTVEAGDDPPVKKKKGKKKKRYIYGGRGSRKMWMPEKDK